MASPGSLRMIGGKFGLETGRTERRSRSISSFLGDGECHFFINARSALMALIGKLDPQRIWLPSFFCPSMLQGMGDWRSKLEFFSVDEWLNVGLEDDLSLVSKGDVVVLIDYFGFRAPDEIVLNLASKGVVVIEDACQALLSEDRLPGAHFLLFSPRKYFGFPDGGILVNRTDSPLKFANLQPPPENWLQRNINGLRLRSSFDAGDSESRAWFDVIQNAEKHIPVGLYAMSEISRGMLETHGNPNDSIIQRRQNFEILANELEDWNVCGKLPKNVVPMAFPVKLKNRDVVQKGLFLQEIFPAIHWHLEGVIPPRFKRSLRLSREIMTLPCDQRYAPSDMLSMARYFKRLAEPVEANE